MKGWKYMIFNCNDFNLKHTFDCGQCFRWNENEDGSFTGVIHGKTVNIKENKDGSFETDLDDYEILNDLAKARENLYQDHCADQEDASGESKEAEALEDAIRDLEDEIENPSSSSGDESGDNSSDDGESEETEEEKNIEQQLEEINKNAQASRGKDMEQSKNIGNYQFYDGKSW